MARVPIPDDLQRRAFTVAEGRAAGMGAGRLAGPDLSRPTHGVRTATAPESFRDRVVATRVALPSDVVFSHLTAARLWGLPLPSELEDGPIEVMRATSAARIRRRGCLGRRGLESRVTSACQGLPATSLADTWCDLGEALGVDDLVVVGDAAVRRLADVGPLRDALGRRVRPRGAVALKEALALVRVGSDSPMESRCRLVFHRAGLPEPELNAVISHRGGGFLCRSDFVWRERRVIGEYQGGDHFGSIRRGDDDISRRLLVEDDGWKYVEMTKYDYYNPARRAGLVARLAAYLL
jgi:hypothetical protein